MAIAVHYENLRQHGHGGQHAAYAAAILSGVCYGVTKTAQRLSGPHTGRNNLRRWQAIKPCNTRRDKGGGRRNPCQQALTKRNEVRLKRRGQVVIRQHGKKCSMTGFRHPERDEYLPT
ncbi:hypothetical protein AA15237_3222 [Komagataeibacter xylinus NBRC 15237]|nr:hypothetical protein AA15237_3222 [Komagataeibacter xylinus NBRC 15237]